MFHVYLYADSSIGIVLPIAHMKIDGLCEINTKMIESGREQGW